MTEKLDRRKVVCDHCKQMTFYSDPASQWIRNNTGLRGKQLTFNDLDMQVRRFSTQKDPRGINKDIVRSMIVEMKTRGAGLESWQRDALIETDACLRTKAFNDQRKEDGLLPVDHVDNHRRVMSSYDGKPRRVVHYGAFLLRMAGETPDVSQWILWENADGSWRRQISVVQLQQLFRFEINPDSLLPIVDRQHKKRVVENPLFDINDFGNDDELSTAL